MARGSLRLFTCLLCISGIVVAKSFEQLSALYQYDRTATLEVSSKEIAHRPNYKLFSLEYAVPNHVRIHSLLVVPNRLGPLPAVVWLHSNGRWAWLGDAVLLANAGAVSLLIDAPGSPSPQSAEQSRTDMIATVIAIRRAVDVLMSRKNVDPKRIGLVGHSYGAMMGAVAASIDSRFKVAVYEVGLLGMSIHIATSPHPWAQQFRKELGSNLQPYLQKIQDIDAKNYIGRAPPIPKLFQAAFFDIGVPHKDAEDFFNAASEPKSLKWYDTGHDVDDVAAIADRAMFLGKALDLGDVAQVLAHELRQ